MGITFIHTADWQIGKSFGGFRAAEPFLMEARLSVIDRIAAVAQRENARHVLVAGDVFDGLTAPRDLLAKFVNHLKAHPALVWHLLPGNHDPAQAGSLWRPLAAMLAHMPSVRLHLAPEPVEIEPGVLLMPAPLKAKSMSTDPTAYMDSVPSAPATIRIGMAHGSAAKFGTSGDAAVLGDSQVTSR